MKRKRSTTDGDERRHKKHKTEHGEEEKKVNDERQRRRTFRDVRKCCTKDLKIMTKTANLCGMIVNKTAEDSKENASKPKAKTGYPEENSFNDAGEKILLRPARNWQDRKALWVEKYGPDTLFVDITKTYVKTSFYWNLLTRE